MFQSDLIFFLIIDRILRLTCSTLQYNLFSCLLHGSADEDVDFLHP